MQETTLSDGRVIRELFQGTAQTIAELRLQKAREAIMHPEVVSFTQKKIGRNARCPCGSGKKFKKCCMGQEWRKVKQVMEKD